MPVIKGDMVPPVMSEGAVVLDLGDLRKQADAILEDANAEAAQRLDAAREEAEAAGRTIRAEAAIEGRAEGEAEGRAAGEAAGRAEAEAAWRERLSAVEAAWSAALESWNEQRDGLMDEAQRDVVALAVAIAERIVQRTIEADPSVVADQLQAVIATIGRPTSVEIVVHPDDRPLLEERLPAIERRLAAGEQARLVTDEAIARGGVVVRSGEGSIDATIGTQLDRIAARLCPARDTERGVAEAAEAASADEAVGAHDAAGAVDADEAGDAPEPPDFTAADDRDDDVEAAA